MKKVLGMIAAGLMLSGCGYSSLDNELTGQVKKVVKNTPLICPDYMAADISLGVMRNGVGSMSSEDTWLYIPNSEDFKVLSQAADTGSLVKVRYGVKRVTFCVEDHQVTSVQLVK